MIINIATRIFNCRVQDKLATQLETVTKQLYDATKILEDDTAVGDALPELIVDNFDNEQMWQEIELQNDPTITALLTSVSRAVASKNLTFAAARHKEKIQEEEIEGEEDEENEDDDIGDLRLDQNSSDDDESEEEKEMKLLLDKAEALVGGEIDSDDDNDGLEMLSDDDDLDEPTGKNSDQKGILKSDGASKKKRSKPTTRSIVDDRFFKLADMEAFLEQEDAKEGRRMRKEHGKDVSSSDEDEEEEVDMFADIPSEDEQVGDMPPSYVLSLCVLIILIRIFNRFLLIFSDNIYVLLLFIINMHTVCFFPCTFQIFYVAGQAGQYVYHNDMYSILMYNFLYI